VFAINYDSADVQTKIVGMGSFEAGEVVKGELNGSQNPITHNWFQRVYMDFGFEATINQRTELTFIGEGLAHYAGVQSKDILGNDVVQYLFYPHHIEGSYSFGQIEHPYLKIGVGVFPFKYNSDVRNLGEYLFRTGTYPPIIFNVFDFSAYRLMGLRFTSNPIDSLNLTAMLTTETQVTPLQDFSLSFLGSYTFIRSITVGGGVSLSHFFSVNNKYTTPVNPNNIYKIDTIISSNDTSYNKHYYTFQATKLMGRISFDPKVFIPLNIFGSNDLRLYSEVACIGLTDYPVYYTDISRRIPVMVGFNIPAFKQLDVLSLELEWYKWNYANSYTQSLFTSQLPLPDPITSKSFNPNEQELRWSVYFRRFLGNGFSITGQIAYDHSRLESNVFNKDGFYYGDAMHNHGDWSWVIKTQFAF
jgi:hypothetical protein